MDIDEQQHFLEVIEGFVHYKEAMNQHLSRKEHGWEVARRAGRVPDELYEKMEVNFKKLREAGVFLLCFCCVFCCVFCCFEDGS